jgi:inorganic pyrophosphatase/exopolyphosphatase
MPVIIGVQLLKTVKDLNPLARTILMTAYDIDNNLLQEILKRDNKQFSKKTNIKFSHWILIHSALGWIRTVNNMDPTE